MNLPFKTPLHRALLAAGALTLALSGCAATLTSTEEAPAASAASATAQARPPLWVVRDADSTLYLFGTVHLLPKGVNWRTPEVVRALAESEEVWFEIAEVGDDAAGAAAMQKLMPTLGLDPRRPLSTKLPQADRTRLQAAATALGLPPAQLEPFRPWLAALTLTVTAIQKAGFDPNLGVDVLLARAARDQNKPIKALETVEQQLRFFADLPPAIELEFLRATLDDIDAGPETLRALADSWARGDLRSFERLFLDEMRQEHPELYRVLLVDRNEAWARAIQAELAGSGVSFFAVGAGHLVGPDSVQERLEARGVRARRR